jgi:hypothetical protein
MAALPKRTVELACRPAVRRSAVEVDCAAAPKLVVGVNGKAAPAAIAPQATTPEELVVSAFEPEQAEIPEIVRLVVLASVVESVVEVAAVAINPPSKLISVVVALLGKR